MIVVAPRAPRTPPLSPLVPSGPVGAAHRFRSVVAHPTADSVARKGVVRLLAPRLQGSPNDMAEVVDSVPLGLGKSLEVPAELRRPCRGSTAHALALGTRPDATPLVRRPVGVPLGLCPGAARAPGSNRELDGVIVSFSPGADYGAPSRSFRSRPDRIAIRRTPTPWAFWWPAPSTCRNRT